MEESDGAAPAHTSKEESRPPARTAEELYDRMSPRQRHFWAEYSRNGYSAAKAYRYISPTANDHTAKVNGCRMLRKIRALCGGKEGLLEAYGLGLDRLMAEIDLRLRAREVKVWQGEVVKDPTTKKPIRFEDNGTRMAATKLLAEIHGARKQSLVGGDGEGPVEVAVIRRVIVRPAEQGKGE